MCLIVWFNRLIAFSLMLAFACTFPMSVWTINFVFTGLSAETYVDTFDDQNVYENIVPLIIPAFAEVQKADPENTQLPGNIAFDEVVKNLDQEDWNIITRDIIPPEYLQSQAEPNLKIYFDFVNGKRAYLDIVFETKLLRENLLGEPGERMVNRIFSSWEACNSTQESQMRLYVSKVTTAFPYCRPTNLELQREAFNALNEAKNEMARQIPDEYSIRHERAAREGISLQRIDQRYYDDLQRPTVMFNNLYLLGFLTPCAFLAMIVILVVRSGKGFMGWMGWSLAFAGILTLLPLLILPFVVGELYTGVEADVDAIQIEAVRGMSRSLIGEFSLPIFLEGSLLVGIGFLSVFISIFLPSPDDEETQTEQQPQQYYGSTPHLTSFTPPSPPPAPAPPQPPR